MITPAGFRFALARQLDRKPTRRVLLVLAHAYARLRERPIRICYRDGMWVHHHPEAAIFNLHIDMSGPEDWTREVLDQFCHAYRPGPADTVVDVGAGIGRETFVFSRLVGPAGTVQAIEAHPRVFRCLNYLVAENQLANVRLHAGAVSDHVGELALSDRVGHLENTAHIGASEMGITVPTTTLDALLDGDTPGMIDLLKMNIEGAEGAALAGMDEALARVRNVAVECHDFLAEATGDERFRTREEVVGRLQGAGFEVASRRTDDRPWIRDMVYGSRERDAT